MRINNATLRTKIGRILARGAEYQYHSPISDTDLVNRMAREYDYRGVSGLREGLRAIIDDDEKVELLINRATASLC